jgi:hypothetical protein
MKVEGVSVKDPPFLVYVQGWRIGGYICDAARVVILDDSQMYFADCKGQLFHVRNNSESRRVDRRDSLRLQLIRQPARLHILLRGYRRYRHN